MLKDAVRLLLSQIYPGFCMADALAQEHGIDRQQMREDCYFSASVDTIAFYCGDEARDLILKGNVLLPRKTVLQISRTAPTRQCYEMEQVKKGRRPRENYNSQQLLRPTLSSLQLAAKFGLEEKASCAILQQ